MSRDGRDACRGTCAGRGRRRCAAERGREMSKVSGSSQRVSSWLAEPMCGETLSPGPDCHARQLHLDGGGAVDGQQRRFAAQALFYRLGQQRAVGPDRVELIGMGQQEVEQVARRAVGRLGPGRQQQAKERVDGLVAQLLAVDLGGDEIADDVLGRAGPALGHDARRSTRGATRRPPARGRCRRSGR